jgi:hypothetical protein
MTQLPYARPAATETLTIEKDCHADIQKSDGKNIKTDGRQ